MIQTLRGYISYIINKNFFNRNSDIILGRWNLKFKEIEIKLAEGKEYPY